MAFFDVSRAMVGAMASGISQAAVDASIKYAQDRVQFGRPIGSFQMIQEMLVDMIAETEAGRLLSFRALDLLVPWGYPMSILSSDTSGMPEP